MGWQCSLNKKPINARCSIVDPVSYSHCGGYGTVHVLYHFLGVSSGRVRPWKTGSWPIENYSNYVHMDTVLCCFLSAKLHKQKVNSICRRWRPWSSAIPRNSVRSSTYEKQYNTGYKGIFSPNVAREMVKAICVTRMRTYRFSQGTVNIQSTNKLMGTELVENSGWYTEQDRL